VKIKARPRRKVRGRESTSESHDDAFRELNQVYNAISGAHEGIVLYDRHLNYRVWNRFMEELTGVPAEKALGRNALELFPHLREQGVDLLLKKPCWARR
jgi:PAS domain-containing protein